MARHPDLEAWDPIALDEATVLFEGAPFRWWVSGGRALELHVGRSWREHEDLDIGVVRQESMVALYEWLEGWDLWLAFGGKLTPWMGEALTNRLDVNNVWGRLPDASSWQIDLTIGSGDHDHWIYRRDPSIERPWSDAVLRTPEGVPYLAPDLQLLFKSKNPRPKDDLDARVVGQFLRKEQRQFLLAHLSDGHPWRKLLS